MDELELSMVEDLLDNAAAKHLDLYSKDVLPDFILSESCLELLRSLPQTVESQVTNTERGQTWYREAAARGIAHRLQDEWDALSSCKK